MAAADGEQCVRATQEGADAGNRRPVELSSLWVERLLQDGLDRPVVRVAVRQRPLAGGVQAHLAIRFGQADDPLALPQMVQVVPVEQFADGRVNVRSKLRGLVAAPGWQKAAFSGG